MSQYHRRHHHRTVTMLLLPLLLLLPTGDGFARNFTSTESSFLDAVTLCKAGRYGSQFEILVCHYGRYGTVQGSGLCHGVGFDPANPLT